jgi:hypothetical protein
MRQDLIRFGDILYLDDAQLRQFNSGALPYISPYMTDNEGHQIICQGADAVVEEDDHSEDDDYTNDNDDDADVDDDEDDTMLAQSVHAEKGAWSNDSATLTGLDTQQTARNYTTLLGRLTELEEMVKWGPLVNKAITRYWQGITCDVSLVTTNTKPTVNEFIGATTKPKTHAYRTGRFKSSVEWHRNDEINMTAKKRKTRRCRLCWSDGQHGQDKCPCILKWCTPLARGGDEAGKQWQTSKSLMTCQKQLEPWSFTKDFGEEWEQVNHSRLVLKMTVLSPGGQENPHFTGTYCEVAALLAWITKSKDNLVVRQLKRQYADRLISQLSMAAANDQLLSQLSTAPARSANNLPVEGWQNFGSWVNNI